MSARSSFDNPVINLVKRFSTGFPGFTRIRMNPEKPCKSCLKFFAGCVERKKRAHSSTSQSPLRSSCGYNPAASHKHCPQALKVAVMNQAVIKKWRQAAVPVALAALLTCACLPAAAQQMSNAERATELAKIRNELRARDSFRNADVVVVLSERAIA